MKPRIFAHVLQGGIVVNPGALIRDIGSAAQEWRFDLEAKHAQVFGYQGSGVLLGASERTMHLDETKRDECTHVWFTFPRGWELLTAHVCRYTLSVYLGRCGNYRHAPDIRRHTSFDGDAMNSVHDLIISAVEDIERDRDQAKADLAACQTKLAVVTHDRDTLKEDLFTMREKFRDLSAACQELDLTGEHATIVAIRKAMLL